MLLEVGKKYVARNGEVFGPIVETTVVKDFSPEFEFYDLEGSESWRADGTWAVELVQHPMDLIREYVELSVDDAPIAAILNKLADQIHRNNVDVGWWTDKETGEDVRTWPKKFLDLWIGSKLMLIVTEIAEAMEGHRKGLMDDKLPHRPMITVELADALIRILDMAGGINAVEHPIGDVVQEKRAYNATRADHQLENRLKAGGKSI